MFQKWRPDYIRIVRIGNWDARFLHRYFASGVQIFVSNNMVEQIYGYYYWEYDIGMYVILTI